MRKKETAQHAKHLARGFRSHGDPMYQQHRSAVVDWICQVGEVCRLGNLTIHTAIGFMDMFLDIIPIDGSRPAACRCSHSPHCWYASLLPPLLPSSPPPLLPSSPPPLLPPSLLPSSPPPSLPPPLLPPSFSCSIFFFYPFSFLPAPFYS